HAICAILLFIAYGNAHAFAAGDEENPVEITSEVDKNAINVGDRIKLKLLAEKPASFEVLFSEDPKAFGDFVLVVSRPVTRGWGSLRKTGHEYELTIYTTGTHVIPPVGVKFRKKGEASWRVMNTPQTSIEVKSLLTGRDTDIRDLKGLAAFGGSRAFVIILLILAATGTAWFIWVKKRRGSFGAAVEKEKSAYEVAYEQLKLLKEMDLPKKGRIKEYYTMLSDIIRHYLENRFSFRAPEMTTEEFMAKLKKSPEMQREHKRLLKDFLSHCDLVKFAKYGPTLLEMIDSYSSAERLLDETLEEEEVKEA
ncbi:MAG: hypothetical protein ABIH74_04955, partial [Candidatus Omnitrophota bacterium]